MREHKSSQSHRRSEQKWKWDLGIMETNLLGARQAQKGKETRPRPHRELAAALGP